MMNWLPNQPPARARRKGTKRKSERNSWSLVVVIEEASQTPLESSRRLLPPISNRLDVSLTDPRPLCDLFGREIVKPLPRSLPGVGSVVHQDLISIMDQSSMDLFQPVRLLPDILNPLKFNAPASK